MLKLLANIPLKYKFWLVNAVSFGLLLVVVLFSISQENRAVEEQTKANSEDQLKNLLLMTQDMDESVLGSLVKKTHNAFILDAGGRLLSNGNLELPQQVVRSLKDARIGNTQLVRPAFWEAKPVYAVALQAHPNGVTIGSVAQGKSFFSIFLQQAPSYALLVFCLMLILLAASQMLVQFVEKFTEVNKGKAFFSGLDGLGDFVFNNYKTNRKNRKR